MVPYRGAAPALQVLVAGQIDILFDQASKALPQLRANNVKAYAVTAKDPLPAAPEISTVDAAGLPGSHMTVWHGLWAPKGTPARMSSQSSMRRPSTRWRTRMYGQD
jgi:tripartite-type tricarboxylate transporter receptor subunit TctC